jgi:hypothetical protein
MSAGLMTAGATAVTGFVGSGDWDSLQDVANKTNAMTKVYAKKDCFTELSLCFTELSLDGFGHHHPVWLKHPHAERSVPIFLWQSVAIIQS